MKKNKMDQTLPFLKRFLLCTAFCSAFFLMPGCDRLQSAKENTEEAIVEETEYDCFVRGNCTTEQYNALLSHWNKLPDAWKDRFEADGWIVLVTNDNFWGVEGFTNLLGLTNPIYKTIYIHAECNSLDDTMGHEFGHYIDYVLGYPSESDEFRRLWIKEGAGFEEVGRDDGYARTNVTEFFAAICYQMIEAPETEESAPESFAFVRSCTEEMTNETEQIQYGYE